jgi:hypothetical protein
LRQNYFPPEGHVEPEEQNNIEEIIQLAEEPIEEVLAEPNNDNDQANNDIETEMDLQCGERTVAYNLWQRQARDYGHLHTLIGHLAFTQLSMKQGLKTFGTQGQDAVLSEIKQLHNWGVIQPRNPHTLSLQVKRDALEYLRAVHSKRCNFFLAFCTYASAENCLFFVLFFLSETVDKP